MVYMMEPLRETTDAIWDIKQRGIKLGGRKEKTFWNKIKRMINLANNSHKPQKILEMLLPLETDRHDYGRSVAAT